MSSSPHTPQPVGYAPGPTPGLAGRLGATGLAVAGAYCIAAELSTGRWTTVNLGVHLSDPAQTPLAIKRLRPQVASDPRYAEPFYDEGQIARHVAHRCVISALDVVPGSFEVVFPYIHGESLAKLLGMAYRQQQPAHPAIVRTVVVDLLRGLHAIHDAGDAQGRWLGLVHRAVSAQNVLVGIDGVARLHDFGVTQALGRPEIAQFDSLRGPTAYLAPEQLVSRQVDRRADLFSTAILLWEALTCKRLFQAASEVQTRVCIERLSLSPPSRHRAGLTPELDAVVMAGLARDPTHRFQTALNMAQALRDSGPSASHAEVSQWVQTIAHQKLQERAIAFEGLRSQLSA